MSQHHAIYKIARLEDRFRLYPLIVERKKSGHETYSLVSCAYLCFHVPVSQVAFDGDFAYCIGSVAFNVGIPLYNYYPSLKVVPIDKIDPLLCEKHVLSVALETVSDRIQDLRSWYNLKELVD